MKTEKWRGLKSHAFLFIWFCIIWKESMRTTGLIRVSMGASRKFRTDLKRMKMSLVHKKCFSYRHIWTQDHLWRFSNIRSLVTDLSFYGESLKFVSEDVALQHCLKNIIWCKIGLKPTLCLMNWIIKVLSFLMILHSLLHYLQWN